MRVAAFIYLDIRASITVRPDILLAMASISSVCSTWITMPSWCVCTEMCPCVCVYITVCVFVFMNEKHVWVLDPVSEAQDTARGTEDGAGDGDRDGDDGGGGGDGIGGVLVRDAGGFKGSIYKPRQASFPAVQSRWDMGARNEAYPHSHLLGRECPLESPHLLPRYSREMERCFRQVCFSIWRPGPDGFWVGYGLA